MTSDQTSNVFKVETICQVDIGKSSGCMLFVSDAVDVLFSSVLQAYRATYVISNTKNDRRTLLKS